MNQHLHPPGLSRLLCHGLLALVCLLAAPSASARPQPFVDNDGDGYSEVKRDCNDKDPKINPGATEICGDGIDQNCDRQDAVCPCEDVDGDGFCTEDGDCDDSDPGTYPDAVDYCDDGIDQNCDGVDEACPCYDLDRDGFCPEDGDCDDSDDSIYPGAYDECDDGIDQDCSGGDEVCPCTDADGDGVCVEDGDCNDANAAIYPGATETCDSVDNNCNGSIDEGVEASTWYADGDGDGFGTNSSTTVSCSQPSGYVLRGGDCNDNNSSIYPGVVEVCDFTDNDCDGSVDEGVEAATWYRDADGDTYGSASSSTAACTQPSGYVARAGDCNDANATVNPGAGEACDGIDNDCDTSIDEGATTTFYVDSDGDGIGSSSTVQACSSGAGLSSLSGDCNDSNASVYPGASETCGDGVDQDCSGADQVCACIDADGDGVCGTEGDCNDNNAQIYPGAAESCDGIDNDCDSSIDEGLATSTWYPDADRDGFGANSGSVTSCSQPSGFVSSSGDCNDNSAAINPGAAETCDGVDNNCNGSIDDGVATSTWYRDADGDTYGNSSDAKTACSQPAGYVSRSGDCNDGAAAINPGASETCDGIDNNCNGSIDDGVTTSTWYRDADGDTYGTSSDTKTACAQPAGYVGRGGDCNDGAAAINPGASETCDGIDNNCNGSIDDGVATSTWYRDADGDTYGTSSDTKTACAQPAGYVGRSGDCNDSAAAINPGASETCDGVDNNCNGSIDDGVTTSTWYRDADGDGYGTSSNTQSACSQPSGYVAQSGDCNDNNAAVKPGATEQCDSIDNDCDGSIDEDTTVSTWYPDSDGDTYGTSSGSVTNCKQPSGYASRAGDCNDNNAAINPGASETCDGVDNNCNGSIDDGVSSSTWYRDADGDTYGTNSDTQTACSQPSGYVSRGGDCNDSSASINPGVTEVCDGVDNNCNGSIDDGITTSTWYRDADSDTYGTNSDTKTACSQPAGYVSRGGDCNDSAAAINPGATETCDGVDNNCNGSIDDGVTTSTWYRDADGDTYGNSSDTKSACSQPSGYVNRGGDCNDSAAVVNPGATEVCDSVDNNCNGSTDEGVTTTYYRDADNDGYGVTGSTTAACSKPSGYAAVGGDCNDSNAAVNPGATEVCDSVDNNCNGSTDEGVSPSTWYRDADGDTYGTSASTTTACTKPTGYVSVSGDCNDSNAAIYPGATEVCDQLDNDCDSSIDEGLATSTYYPDADNDTYGAATGSVSRCAKPTGYVTNNTDCNDSNAAINPGATEITADNVDQNCNGQETCYKDADNDGYRPDSTSTVNSTDTDCLDANEAVASDPTTDCNDSNAAIKPGATETCDGVDNDCDAAIDEGVKTNYYADTDADAFGNPNDVVASCSPVSGRVTAGGDCDDKLWLVNPDGQEVCNGVDDDCDGLVDSSDSWDVNSNSFTSFNANCDTYDRVSYTEIPLLKINAKVGPVTDNQTYPDNLVVAGHTPGATKPSDWPAGCLFFDVGINWYDLSSTANTLPSKACFSKGIDSTGGDQVNLQVTYSGLTIKGVFNNDPDSDASDLDTVRFAPEESDSEHEVWYVSDSGTSTGTGYSVYMEIKGSRIVVDLNN